MTDLAARLSALEAREQARDAVVLETALLLASQYPVAPGAQSPATGLNVRLAEWEAADRCAAPPPSAPAAEEKVVPVPEPRIEDRWITEARQVYGTIAAFGWQTTWRHDKPVPDDAWPIDIIAKALRAAATNATSSPSPETIARVRERLRYIAHTCATWGGAQEAARDALHFLDGAEPRETGP